MSENVDDQRVWQQQSRSRETAWAQERFHLLLGQFRRSYYGDSSQRSPRAGRLANQAGANIVKEMNRNSNPTTMRTHSHARIFALAVLALVVGMVGLAVAAKTLHYSARTAQTRYFSSSVKMANYGHRQAPSVRYVAVPAPLVRLQEPEQFFFALISSRFPAGSPSKTGPLQLRSPPISS